MLHTYSVICDHQTHRTQETSVRPPWPSHRVPNSQNAEQRECDDQCEADAHRWNYAQRRSEARSPTRGSESRSAFKFSLIMRNLRARLRCLHCRVGRGIPRFPLLSVLNPLWDGARLSNQGDSACVFRAPNPAMFCVTALSGEEGASQFLVGPDAAHKVSKRWNRTKIGTREIANRNKPTFVQIDPALVICACRETIPPPHIDFKDSVPKAASRSTTVCPVSIPLHAGEDFPIVLFRGRRFLQHIEEYGE